MDFDERTCLSKAMKVVQDRRQPNIFTLTATSKTRGGAADKVNVYADMLIDAYVAFRTDDLDYWKRTFEAKRKAVAAEIASVDAEEEALTARVGVLSPRDALLTLNLLLSDQRRNALAFGVDIANEEMKRKKLAEEVGDYGPAVMANAQAIRRRVDAITAIDEELVKLRDKYTDMHPKVSGKLKEREDLANELKAFLKSKGAEGLDIDKMDVMEKSAGLMADCTTRIEVINEKKRALEQEISENENRAAKLVANVKEYDNLESTRKTLKSTLSTLDEQISNISYASGILKNDLRQVERASGAGDNASFGVKQAILAGGAGGAGAFVLMIFLLTAEMCFGKVRGGKEISAYGDIKFLGSLPKDKALKEDEERDMTSVLAQKTLAAGRDVKTVLVCRLPGAEANEGFAEVMDFTASMSGSSCFIIDVVAQGDFTPPEGGEEMIGIVRSGQHGWFPVANRFAVAPTELMMLKADMATLGESFDNIFIRLAEDGIHVGGTFFDQIQELCGAVLLAIGDHTTPRRALAYARRRLKESGKPVLAIATGARAKTVRAEMEVMK